jgi:hypothetical protein
MDVLHLIVRRDALGEDGSAYMLRTKSGGFYALSATPYPVPREPFPYDYSPYLWEATPGQEFYGELELTMESPSADIRRFIVRRAEVPAH